MDFSKLPRMSDTPPAPAPVPKPAEPMKADVRSTGGFAPQGAETALLGVGIAAIFILLTPALQNMLKPPPITDVDGTPISYWQSGFFWTDLGWLFFLLTIAFCGLIVGLTRAPMLRYACVLLAGLSIALNIYVLVAWKSKVGIPIANAFAILFAGVAAINAIRRA
jgi:hypothetical protein